MLNIFSGTHLQSLIVFSALLVCFSHEICDAQGPVDGAKAAGMGTAFVAVADDPSAILFNPAGLTQLPGTNFYSGGSLIVPSSQYKSPSGKSEKTEFQTFFAPHLYASSDFNTKEMCFGLGVYSPFGIGGTKWSETGLTRYISTDSLIGTVAVNPVAAWRLTPWLSLGAGFYYECAEVTSERMINQSSLRAGDGKFSLESHGLGGGWGYNAGILFFPGQRFSFGLSYRSWSNVGEDMTLTLDNIAPALRSLLGGSSFKTGASSSIDFPQAVCPGVAFRPTERLTFSFDANWLGWSSLKVMNVDLQRKVPQAGVTDISIPFDFKDAWMLKAGFEYKLNDKLALRGGYMYTENNMPDITLNPGNPNADQHGVTLGLGYKMGRFTFDTFCLGDFYDNRKVSNEILIGEYRSFMLIVGSSVNFKWK
jgi:long-chain fatty acid transport protein